MKIIITLMEGEQVEQEVNPENLQMYISQIMKAGIALQDRKAYGTRYWPGHMIKNIFVPTEKKTNESD